MHANDYIEAMKRVALEAGAIALEGFHKILKYDTKDGPSDLVTEYDRRCEDYIRSKLPSLDYFFGEESSDGAALPKNGSGWVVDPIDGTTNFVHGVEYFGISIALVKDGVPVIGVIYAPARSTLYYAISGKGAYISKDGIDQPLIVKNKDAVTLNTALVACEFGGCRGDGGKIQRGLDEMKRLLNLPVHGVRNFGAATMNIMNVATGVVDAYYERGLKPWDMAAAVVIIQEAGGIVSGITKNDFDLSIAETIVAVNLQVAQQLRQVLLQ
jgi:myo-inositol-1(or 4)-monophosphatase